MRFVAYSYIHHVAPLFISHSKTAFRAEGRAEVGFIYFEQANNAESHGPMDHGAVCIYIPSLHFQVDTADLRASWERPSKPFGSFRQLRKRMSATACAVVVSRRMLGHVHLGQFFSHGWDSSIRCLFILFRIDTQETPVIESACQRLQGSQLPIPTAEACRVTFGLFSCTAFYADGKRRLEPS